MRVTSNALIRARRLRRNMSLPEVLLWRCLRGREPGKPVFRRQHPLGPFVLDFFCPNASLCIEIDGGGHGFGDQPQRDARRDGYLRSLGIRTIRLNASDVIASPQTFADGLIALAVECSGNLPRSGSVRGRWIAAEERRDGGGAASGKAWRLHLLRTAPAPSPPLRGPPPPRAGEVGVIRPRSGVDGGRPGWPPSGAVILPRRVVAGWPGVVEGALLRDRVRIRWDRVLPLAAVVVFWILVFWAGSRLVEAWR